LAIALAALVTFCSCAQNKGGKKASKAEEFPLDSLEIKYNPGIEKGAEAPAFELPDTLGNILSLNNFKGKYVVIDFWASWCGDCRREIPEVKALYQTWKDAKINGAPIQFLSVSFDHDAESWKTILRAEEFEWPQVSNLVKYRGHPLAAAYGLHWIPSFAIVAPDGKIAGTAITSKRVDIILKQLQ